MRTTATILLILLVTMLTSPNSAVVQGSAVCTADKPSENVVVFLSGAQLPKLEPPGDPVTMDQRNLRFTPHVLPIMRGTTVAFPNSDPIRHNVFSASDARMSNLGTYPPGVTPAVSFDRPGLIELLCNVHPEMSAYILVLDTSYFTTTGTDGRFRIEEVLPGSYTLVLWCEHRGFIERPLVLKPGQRNLMAVLHSNQVQLDQGNGAQRRKGREKARP